MKLFYIKPGNVIDYAVRRYSQDHATMASNRFTLQLLFDVYEHVTRLEVLE